MLAALALDFSRAYPRRAALTVAGLVAAGILEGIGIMAFLPVITLVGGDGSAPESPLNAFVVAAFDLAGLEPTLGLLLILIVLGFGLKGVVLLWTTLQVGYSVAQVTADLRKKYVAALMTARWGYFTSLTAGGIANTISSEAERSARAYEALCHMIALGLQAAVYVGIAFLVSWEIALAGLIAGLVGIAALNRLVHLARRVGRDQTEFMHRIMSRVTNSIAGMKPLKAMARESQLRNFLNEMIDSLNLTARRTVFYRQSLATIQEPIIVVFLALGIFVADTILTVPITIQLAMAVVFLRLMTRLNNMQAYWQTAMLAESAYWALRGNLKNAEAQAEASGSGLPPPASAIVRVEKVSFDYDEHRVLDNVSLEIRPGEITTLIGPSGSGKTTLADLIVGLRRPRTGRITIGDFDLNALDNQAWRRSIGYVPQGTILFGMSLLSNVTLDDPEISEERAIEAVRKADAWSFVERLPNGIDTVIGEGGVQISGGQGQRIAIARALVRSPSLLILDEATAALDPETEAAICRTVAGLTMECAVLAITHQPAWIDIADRVYGIEHGVISLLTDRSALEVAQGR